MQKQSSLFFPFIISTLLILLSTQLQNCANRIPPTGGPKDTLSPVLQRSIPANQSTNYRGKLIVLTFDEWIKTEGIYQELTITPPIEGFKSKVVKNRLEITLDSALRQNTTYNFNFRESIKDITEGNVAKVDTLGSDLRIAFSTGDVLDSMRLDGEIRDPFTNKLFEQSLIALYREDDTLKITEHKPLYFTYGKKDGQFSLENLPPGEYRVYAFVDKNNNLRYDEPEPITFIPEVVQFGDSLNYLPQLKMLPTAEDHTPPLIDDTKPQKKYIDVIYEEGLRSIEVKPFEANSEQDLPYLLINKGKTLRIFNVPERSDSLKVLLSASDSSSNQRLDTLSFAFAQEEVEDDKRKNRRKGKDDKDLKVENRQSRLSLTLSPNGGDGLEDSLSFWIDFPQPIATHDFSKLSYLPDKDSTRLTPLFNPDKAEEFRWENQKSRLRIQKPADFKQEVEIIIDSAAFVGILGDSSQAFSRSLKLKDIGDFGSISGQVITQEPYYVLQLLNATFEVVAESYNRPKFDFLYLQGGTYYLRVIVDKNQNKRWDGGNVEENIPAEPLLFFNLPNEGRLKPRWDIQGVELKF